MNRDIRALILYKQHYLNEYKHVLNECQYSCWGYYDGMSVEPVEKAESKLFEKRSASPISDLWYHTVGKAGDLKAWYGEQNIGLFRCVPKSEDEICSNFWDRHEAFPYFSVAFLQLRDNMEHKEVVGDLEHEEVVDSPEQEKVGNSPGYEKVRDSLEKTYQKNEGRFQYNLLAYCTFDNADLVLLLQGNSITRLEEILKEIEECDDVAYLHPIMGASEKYLQESELSVWNGLDCNVTERIAEIRMSVSSSGNSDILRWIRTRLSEVFQGEIKNISCFTVSGHSDLVLSIRDVQVKNLLTFLQKDGFATHQNELYKNGVYNIESSICIKECSLEEIPGKELPETKSQNSIDWCYKMIKAYTERFHQWKDNGNESMYSYYQALLQTLNTLGQYENFSLANGIFYQLFPSFRMFLRQLDMALKQAEENRDNKMLEKIKESVCQYLESVNSVMYHTTHTDQMFLMIPGCSGTTFSIPVKLSLLYSWFCSRVINILNDSKENYEYQCLITPAMEAKPGTEPIGFGLGHGNRLVQVKLSQRSLYMPRALMIILAHELGHYVGEEVRQRKYRAEEIIRALAALLTEGIIPEVHADNTEIMEKFGDMYREKMQVYIAERLAEKLRVTCKVNGYHASHIANELLTGCKEILASEGAGLEQIIYKVPAEIKKDIKRNDESSLRKMKHLRLFQEECDKNRRLLLVTAADNLDRIVNELIGICREVFSDTAAFAILGFDLDIFGEAFDISEGVANEEKYDERQSIRKEVMEYLILECADAGEKTPAGISGYAEENNAGPKGDNGIKAGTLRYNLLAYDCTKRLLKRYAKRCYEKLKIRVAEKQKEKDSITDVFNMFVEKDSYSCSQIFEAIYNRTNEYIREIEASRTPT